LKNFALIGAAGYIAPRHLKAIHETGNRLVAAVDKHDSVGAMDEFFPDAEFFTEIERFDRFVEKLRRDGSDRRIDYVSVCSPNYLHDAHARLGLRVHADVVCEKPLSINPWNIDALAELEQEFGQRVYCILQLRLLKSLIDLKQRLEADPNRKKADVVLSYITRRGPWYHVSWKGDAARSGGVAMNIGIHFFDLLMWIFGDCERSELHLSHADKMAGVLDLKWARVRWLLSLDKRDLPDGYLEQGKPAHRSLTIDGEELDFAGFTELHTQSYEHILDGRGFGLADARPSVELVHSLRNAPVTEHPDHPHPGLAASRGQGSPSRSGGKS